MNLPAPDVLTLKGRVALVTGAGRGIGAATATLMARAGARVVVVDADGASVTDTAAAIGLAGGDALSFAADVADAFTIERVADRAIQEFGRLDILVNNAGIVHDGRIGDLSDDDWQRTIDVNLHGAMICARSVVPQMLKQKYGRLLSATSIVARCGNFGQTAYAASKAGIIGMTRVWARELGPHGITANAVAPGFIETEMVRGVPEKVMRELIPRIPAGRLGRPEEVANVYLFLASDLASFVNGAVVGVDGGLLL